MNSKLTLTFVLALSTMLMACENKNIQIGEDFGNSVRQNMAAHIINPAPEYDPSATQTMDGARAADAVERYRTGETLELEDVTTSELGEND